MSVMCSFVSAAAAVVVIVAVVVSCCCGGVLLFGCPCVHVCVCVVGPLLLLSLLCECVSLCTCVGARTCDCVVDFCLPVL